MPISYFPPLISNLDWGKLTGEISTQSDLAAALAQKADINHTHQDYILCEKSTSQEIISTNYTEITGLQFALTAGKYYEIELMLLVNKSADTGANDLRLRCELAPEIVYLACFTACDINMKNILVAACIILPASLIAQVQPMHKLPEKSNNVQTIQPAFQTPANLVKVVLVCNANNLSGKYNPVVNLIPTRDYFTEVIIDNPLSNNNPDAFIMVTPVRTDPLPVSVYYDQSVKKWKIRVDANGQDNRVYGNANPSERGQNMVSVLPYAPQTLVIGDKFNILINQ